MARAQTSRIPTVLVRSSKIGRTSFKVFTSYAATSRVTVSGYLRVQSGAPWAARGRDWAGAVLNYLEPAGSHRNPTWANLDLMGAYRLPLSGRAERLDRSAPDERLRQPDPTVDRRAAVSGPAERAGRRRTLPRTQQPNPFFATGNGFAPPRRLHVAVLRELLSRPANLKNP